MHEAIGTVQSDEQETGTVLDELSRGYLLGDEVLRPARVRVAQ
jgi:molecular chaperone GrpE